MTGSNSNRTWPWWATSALWAIGVTLLAWCMLPSSRIDWRIYLGLFAVVFIVAFYQNPRLRYLRLASSLLALWMATRLGPTLTLLYSSGNDTLAVSLKSELGWLFDFAIGLCLLAALYLDYRERGGKAFGPFVNFGGKSQQQVKENQGQAISVGHAEQIIINELPKPPSKQELDEAVTDSTANPNAGLGGSFHDQIDVAVSYLKDDKVDVAIEWLLRIKKREWHKLDVREKYRVLANLGHCRTRKDEFQQALLDFRDALTHQPDDVEARSHMAAAEFSAGNDARAADLSRQILKDHPEDLYATAIVLRTASPEVLAESQSDSLPEGLLRKAPIISALAWRGIRNNEFAFVRTLLASSSDVDDCSERDVLSAVVTICELAQRVQVPPGPAHSEAESLKLAASDLEEAIEKIERGPGKQQVGQAYYYLASAYQLIGNQGKTEYAYKRATSLWPQALDIGRQYVRFLVDSGRLPDGIVFLESCKLHQSSAASRSLLAACLAERNLSGDRDKAVTILESLIPELPEADLATASNALNTLCILLGELGQRDKADQYVDALMHESLSLAHRFSIKATTRWKSGPKEDSRRLCRQALESLTDEEEMLCLWNVAEACRSVGLIDESLEVFMRFVSPSGPPQHVMALLECASKAGRSDVVLDFCKRLRTEGAFLEAAIELEAYHREKFDDDAGAIEAIDAYLTRMPEGNFADLCRLRRAVIGIKYDRDSLWKEVPAEDLPPVEDADGHTGGLVVTVLKRQGKDRDAIAYSYELLRQNVNDSLASRAFLMAIGMPGETVTLPKPSIAAAGCAIEYEEKSNTERGWWIIEDNPAPEYDLRELAPDHPVAIQLVGRRVGDEFDLRPSGIQESKAVIRQIIDKHAYRCSVLLDTWEDRFQEDPFIWKLQMQHDKSGNPDLSPLFEQLDKKAEAAEQLKAAYLQGPLSIASFSVMSGVDPIDAAAHLASEDGLPIRCCFGHDKELRQALFETSQSKCLVVCPSALATLWLINAWDQLRDLPFNLLVAKSVLVQLRTKQEEGLAGGGRFIHKGDDCYVLTERSSAEQEQAKTDFASYYSWICDSTIAVDGTAMMDLPPSQQGNFTNVFGKECAQTIAYAAKEGIPLWTDDLGIAELSRTEIGVVRTWTDVVLTHLKESQSLSPQDWASFVANLNGCGYVHTRLTPEVIVAAAKNSAWNPEHFLLRAAMRWLLSPGLDPRGVAQIVSRSLPLLWQASALAEQAKAVTIALFVSLASDSVGKAIALAITRHIDDIFGVDVMNAARCREAVQEAMAEDRSTRLINPGQGGNTLDS